MQYRKFGKLNWKSSVLGFGSMRLPQLGHEFTSPINEPEAIRMIRYAIDHGVNYIDTAAIYNMGGSETVVGKALQDGYRQKVKLATKLTPFLLKSPAEFDRFFDEQLKRLQTDKIDFYLLHGMDRDFWKMFKEWKALQFVEKKMAAGQIEYCGFSFHDEFPLLKEIIDFYDNWTMCQVQYNYLDVNKQGGMRGVKYAAGKGLAVVVMEPIRGGLLSKKPPEAVANIWKGTSRKWSLAEWALQWVWNQPEISLALSGMSTMDHVKENLAIADRSAIGILDSQDLTLLDEVKKMYEKITPVPCTGCRYCMPCPNGVFIPFITGLYNDLEVFSSNEARLRYKMFLAEGHGADKCQDCSKCVEACPQKIDIPAELKKAHEALTRG
jgi:uncharacterized protein